MVEEVKRQSEEKEEEQHAPSRRGGWRHGLYQLGSDHEGGHIKHSFHEEGSTREP